MMRKLICLIGAVAMCFALGSRVFAAEQEFVPSITYKDGPQIDSAEMDSQNVGSCLVVTTIQGAKEQKTDITQDARDLLLDVYDQLKEGTMQMPSEAGKVILELVDVSFKENHCVQQGHGHREELEKPGTTVTVTFDLTVPTRAELTVFIYHDGQWKPVEQVRNTGDGEVTCVFEDICPVAFCVDSNFNVDVPKTGDTGQVLLWLMVLVLSGAGVVVLLRRKSR